jgi:hypothetical protein
MAGSSRPVVWASHQTLSAAHTGPCQARDPAGNRTSLHSCFAKARLLWPSEHGHNFAGQPDDPSWRGCSRTTYLGDSPPSSSSEGSPLLVASVLSLCASPCLPARSAGSGTGGSGQTWEATVSAANCSRWPSAEPTDDGRRARCSLTHCRRFPLESHSSQVRWQCVLNKEISPQ